MPHTSHRARTARAWLAPFCLLALFAAAAHASNPRWTTGPPYFSVSNTAVVWYTNQPLYYTDPGDLSVYVNHAAADALVAAAAATWNVPQSMIVLQQGGTLDEQVSGSNVYLGSGGLVFPTDVQSANYAAKPIAVVYDRDGSVTDLLLGGGASAPINCLHNAVTESVDSITPAGYIQHAVLLLNGRCTGAAPEAQLQLQYQIERAFGRILGLGWSQLNDNVFMGTPQPTYNQALHWPIMHPIDVICGVYTYQCVLDAFTLRDDDIASLVFLYPVTSSNVPAGKQPSLTSAVSIAGRINFPVNYEGMGGVNVVLHRKRLPEQYEELFDDVSMVTGAYAQQLHGNPITPKPTTLAGSLGSVIWGQDLHGSFNIAYAPIAAGNTRSGFYLHTEPVNPLYTGQYAIGPYTATPVTPSGTVTPWGFGNNGGGDSIYFDPYVNSAASVCDLSTDGTESAPAPVPATGWWRGLVCSVDINNPWLFSHTAWVTLPVRANRTFTAEMTALDESGYTTPNKVRPVLGIWSATDALGSRPTLASAAVAFNTTALGMTAASAQFTAADNPRIAFTNETGEGRPDYNYQARVLYADTIAPATATAGTPITVSGIGFRPGNTVAINGVLASISSWTSTAIVATAPRLPSVAPGTTATVDVTVTDLATHGSSTMSAAFQYIYTAPVYTLQVVTAPAATEIATLPATPAFAVKVIDADGVTPLANAPVVFSVVNGSASWSACASATCTAQTDANGLASITATPLAAGSITLQAAAVGLTQQVSFLAVPLVRTTTVAPQFKYLAAGATAAWTATATLTQQGQPAALAPVLWSSPSGGNLAISAAQTQTGATGTAQATIQAGPLAAGVSVTGTVCGWSTVCAGFTALGVDVNQVLLVVTGNGTQNIPLSTSFVPITFQVTDLSGNPVAGATVHIHQTTRQWTVPCTGNGRCPVAPVRSATDATLTTDTNGNLSIVPLDMGGAEVTGIVAASGSQGYASLTLQRYP